MLPFGSLSIRTFLSGLFVLMLLFTIGLIVYTDKLSHRFEISEATSIAATTANHIVNDQSQLLSGLEQLAATLSFLPAVQHHNASDSGHVLAVIASKNRKISNIFIADTSGTVWAAAFPQSVRQTVADRRYFKNALVTGTVSSGEYGDGNVTGIPDFGFAYPVKNRAGTVTDIIIMTVLLDMYSDLYKGPFASPVSSILLVDHKGTILYSSVDMTLAGKRDKPELFAKMTQNQAGGAFLAAGNLGIERYFSYRAIRLEHEESPYMYVRTGLDKNEILKHSYHQIGYVTAAVAILLLILSGTALFASKKGLFDKLEQLEHAADRVVQGDFSRRISDNVSSVELDGIVRAFDEMADNLSSNMINLQQSDDALKMSEKKYRDLVENAKTIILKMDAQGRVIYFNEFAEEFFGFTEQELLGRSVIGTIVPETDSSGRDLQEMISRLTKNPSLYISNVNENMRKNGERIWISWVNHELVDADGTYQGVLSIGQDMTEQKKIEEALGMSEQRYRSIIENANDVVFVLTPAGIFNYVSPQWKEAFGYDLSETLGRPFAPFVHPDDVPACLTFLTSVLETGIKLRGVEYRVKHKNGAWLNYTANGSRILDTDNTPLFIGIGRDITEQKLIQKELMKTQKLESISFLAAGIAHNFNNVLTGVIGYISYARKHLKDHDKIAPLLEAAEKSSFRAASLARQLLTFSKGGVPFMSLVTAERLVQESLSLFLSGSNIKGIIHNRSACTVNVDSEQINQAFNNIVLNSIHAMSHGGLLTVYIDDIRLEQGNVYLLKPGNYVKILFEDSGSGIAQENLTKVFDPYFTTRSEGTGLGLSTTQSIIIKHGGYIDIASEVNTGTAVTIMLPAYREKASVEEDASKETEIVLAGIPVLIMDDGEDIRELLEISLGELGFQVETCSTGEEVVEKYKSSWKSGKTLPVVVLDLLVPGGMGGCEAAKRILSIDQHARLVVSSGFTNDPVMADYKNYGFCAALCKPYSTGDLVQVIQQAQQAV